MTPKEKAWKYAKRKFSGDGYRALRDRVFSARAYLAGYRAAKREAEL